MASKDYVIRLTVDDEGAVKNVDQVAEALEQADNSTASLKSQLKQLQKELQGLEVGSEEFTKLSKQAGELKDKINDASEAVRNNAGNSFEVLSNNVDNLSGKFASLDFEGVGSNFKSIASTVKGFSFKEIGAGLQGLKAGFLDLGKAILANPLFLVGAAVGAAIAAVVVYFQEAEAAAQEATDNAIKNIDKLNTEAQRQDKLRFEAAKDSIAQTTKLREEAAQRELDVTNQKLDELDALRAKDYDLSEEQIKQYNDLVKQASDQQVEIERLKLEKIGNLRKINADLDEIIIQAGMTEREKAFRQLENNYAKQREYIEANGGAEEDIAKLDWAYGIQKNEQQKKFAKEDSDRYKAAAAEREKIMLEELARDRELKAEFAKNSVEFVKKSAENLAADLAKFDEQDKAIAAKTLANRLKVEQEQQDLAFQLMADGKDKEIILADQKYTQLRALANGNAELLKQLAEANSKEVSEIENKYNTQRIEEERALIAQRVSMASGVINVLSEISTSFEAKSRAQAKRQFAINKGLQIAQALIQTYQSATGAYASQLVVGDPSSVIRAQIAAGVAIASGLAQVNKIRQTKFNESGGGAGESASVSAGGGGVPSTGGGGGGSQTPTFNPLNTAFLTNRPIEPVPSYVISGTVTNAMEADQKIQDLSRL